MRFPSPVLFLSNLEMAGHLNNSRLRLVGKVADIARREELSESR